MAKSRQRSRAGELLSSKCLAKVQEAQPGWLSNSEHFSVALYGSSQLFLHFRSAGSTANIWPFLGCFVLQHAVVHAAQTRWADPNSCAVPAGVAAGGQLAQQGMYAASDVPSALATISA